MTDPFFARLDSLIKEIENGQPVKGFSKETRELAKQVARQRNVHLTLTPEEKEKWARKLAADVAGAND